MKIPKKIDTLLKKRTKLAQELTEVNIALEDWLENNGATLYDDEIKDAVLSGVMIYCEPEGAEIVVREYIENHM